MPATLLGQGDGESLTGTRCAFNPPRVNTNTTSPSANPLTCRWAPGSSIRRLNASSTRARKEAVKQRGVVQVRGGP